MSHKSYSRCVLGIDRGGTKCDAVLATEDGIVIGTGQCAFTDPESGRGWRGSGRSLESTSIAVDRAMEGVVCEELILTGSVARLELDSFDAHGVVNVQRFPVAESDAAFALSGEDFGLVVLAGTGAFVAARTPDGRSAYIDGLGPMLGDYGSGYMIGSLALKAAAKSFWHPRHATSITELVYDAAIGPHHLRNRGEGSKSGGMDYDGGNVGYALVGYTLGDRDRSEIAAFARIVDGEANRGDAVAREILLTAASSIAETVYDAVDRLGMAAAGYPMIAAGSVAVRSKIYWAHLCSLVKEFAPSIRPIVPDLPQVIGGMFAASRKMHGIDPDTFRKNLSRSYRDTDHDRLYTSGSEATDRP